MPPAFVKQEHLSSNEMEFTEFKTRILDFLFSQVNRLLFPKAKPLEVKHTVFSIEKELR
jgi:hypothetical protein